MHKKYYIFAMVTFFFVTLLPAQNDLNGSVDLINKYGDTARLVKKEKNKFLPIALPITEPAVGYGLAAGLLYFMPKNDSKLTSDMAGAMGGGTSNGTWFAGGGYLGYWKRDRLRYTGFAGLGRINLDYYGFGGEPVAFSQEVAVFMQQLKFRMGDSKFYMGGKMQFSKIKIFREGDYFDPEDLDLWNNGIGFIAEYDKLNNFLSPTKGLKVSFTYDQMLELLGTQTDWGRLQFNTRWYLEASELWVPAFRFEFATATGDPPFYAYPYVSLRGIPAMRYQAKSTLVLETEQLFNITDRWGVVGFTGIGSAISSVDQNISNEIVWNAGAGVRFTALKSLGVKVGADIARGPEDWAFYVSIGSAW